MRVCGVLRFGVTHMKCVNEWCELTDLDPRLCSPRPRLLQQRDALRHVTLLGDVQGCFTFLLQRGARGGGGERGRR